MKDDPDPRSVAELLDGISGAFERAKSGLAQARVQRGIPLEDI
jgi:hypothetical protein